MPADIPEGATDPTKKPPYISDRAYAFLKPLTQMILPAMGSLYYGLASIWGFPEPENVVGSIAVINTFLGVVLGVSTKNYREAGDYLDGDMVIKKAGGRKIYSLELRADPDPLENKEAVIFAVKKEDE